MFKFTFRQRFAIATLVSIIALPAFCEDEVDVEQLAPAISKLSPSLYENDDQDDLRSMVRDDLRQRLQAANDRSSAEWHKIKTREDWEAFRKPRLDALRKSLGDFPSPPEKINIRITGETKGNGVRIQNLVFESRPGLWVTANLYVPDEPAESMPGIILCHSHHRPKEHGELQDMGMTWAMAGCLVLVPDHLGHGERRQHPFVSSSDYTEEFRVSRQDYYFRYDTAMQLHLVGDSLIGWMVWDLLRCVDVLLAQKGIDPKRICLLGAVAGGGDPAAVCAAVDERITCAVPFNFGGPQPETRFPLPEDVEKTFNYAGSGGWESTRNLRLSAADGFLPWVIVGGIAPRRLIFAHEFSWHRERDPVWKRLHTIYGLCETPDNLAFTHGRGELRGRPPEATHCTHIGKFHREKIHTAFKQWFNISATEFSQRLDSSVLLCMKEDVEKELKPGRLVGILPSLADERIAAARSVREKLSIEKQRDDLRRRWSAVLGDVEPKKPAKIQRGSYHGELSGTEHLMYSFEFENGIKVPVFVFMPAKIRRFKKIPLVIGLAQAGKEGFLKNRSEDIAKFIKYGFGVFLPDFRGTGETKPGNDRGRYSADTGRSSTELMLGGTTVGGRLSELRTIIKFARELGPYDPEKISLWGDSFSKMNANDRDFVMPRRIGNLPRQAEPLGGLLALLGGLFDDKIATVYVRGGLTGFRSVLEKQHVYIPHDVVIPGALTTGDLNDIAAALAPRPLALTGLVDSWNRQVVATDIRDVYRIAHKSYRKADAEKAIIMGCQMIPAAAWVIKSTDALK